MNRSERNHALEAGRKERAQRSVIRSAIQEMAVVLSIILSLFILHPKWLPLFTTHIIGGTEGDSGLYVWLVQEFIQDPLRALRFETNAYYPYSLTRAWSDNFLLPSAAIALLTKIGASFEAAYNLVVILAIFLNGWCSYRLLRVLGGSRWASACAGVAFANAAYFTGNLGHPQLLYAFWVPLALSFISSHPSLKCWIVAGFSVTGALLCGVYYGIFTATAVGIAWIIWFFRSTFKSSLLWLCALLIGVLPALWAIVPYLRVKAAFGGRGIYEAFYFSATALSYLSFTNFSALFSKTSAWSHSEATLCPGYLVLALAVVLTVREARSTLGRLGGVFIASSVLLVTLSALAIPFPALRLCTAIIAWIPLGTAVWIALRVKAPVGILLLFVVSSFVLSLGPLGNPEKGHLALAPYAFAHAFIPGMESVRAVARHGSMVILGVYMAAFYCLDRAEWRSGPARHAALTTLLVITIIENFCSVSPLDPRIPAPEAFKVAAQVVKPQEAAIVLPLAGELERDGTIAKWSHYASLNSRYALWASENHLRIVNGYSGQRPRLHERLPALLRNFPDAASLNEISRICGVTHIIVLPHLYSSWDEQGFQSALQSLSGRVSIVYQGPIGERVLSFDRLAPLTDRASIWTAPSDQALMFDILNYRTAFISPLFPPLPYDSLETLTISRRTSPSAQSPLAAPKILLPGNNIVTIPPLDAWAATPSVLMLQTTSLFTAAACNPLAH